MEKTISQKAWCVYLKGGTKEVISSVPLYWNDGSTAGIAVYETSKEARADARKRNSPFRKPEYRKMSKATFVALPCVIYFNINKSMTFPFSKKSKVPCPLCGAFRFFRYKLFGGYVKGKGYCHECKGVSDLEV